LTLSIYALYSDYIYAMELEKDEDNIIMSWRSLMGPTNSEKARDEAPNRYSNTSHRVVILDLIINRVVFEPYLAKMDRRMPFMEVTVLRAQYARSS
jgi:hypothetical protein